MPDLRVPWRVEKSCRANGFTLRVLDADDKEVVRMSPYPPEEQHAKARLIALAPELLEACEAAEVWIDVNADSEYAEPPPILELRAAIAKAKEEHD
jgi:hypothetical protein